MTGTDTNTETNGRTVFRLIPKEQVRKFLFMQFILAAIPIATFCMIFLEIIVLPNESYSLSNDGINFRVAAGAILSLISLFTFSALFCCLGLFVSHAGRADYDTLPSNVSLIVSINFVGAAFGVLIVFMFMGGFISGTLFPNFGTDGGGRADLRSVYGSMTFMSLWAKLAVWSFIVGFSERLLPNLLNNFASQIDPAVKEEK